MKKSEKKPFHEEFAEKVIKMLKEGTAPWQRPWEESVSMIPRNPVSGTVYKGVNHLNLALAGMGDPRWMTFKQAQDAGYRIKKGSHATDIVFYQFARDEPVLDEEGKPVLDEEGMPKVERVRLARPILRFSQVFNGSQIEGLPPLEERKVTWEPLEKAEKILENSGATIIHDQYDSNFYRPRTDEIHLTPKSSFDAPDKYYATALHELGHWTGHTSRLNREFGPYGSDIYAKEELRAEISSWMLGQEIGVGHDPGQHAAYVQSWIKALVDDPMEIVRACRDAEQIKEFVLGLERQKNLENQKAQDQEKTEKDHLEQDAARQPGSMHDKDRQKQKVDPALAKTYLYVPYREKEAAKSYGARWDAKEKQWYAPEGTDLEPLRKWISPPDRKLPAPQPSLDPRQEFAKKLHDLGLDLKGEPPVLDGKVHRVPLLSKNGHGLDGVYCLYGDGRPAGWAQNHSTGEKIKLVATGVVLSPEERERQRAEHAEKMRQAERARAIEHDKTAAYCQGLWEKYAQALPDHGYLKEKGVEAFGVRQTNHYNLEMLVVPVKNAEGQIRGLQYIAPGGRKSFMPGMEKKGNFHLIMENEKKDLSKTEILLCEGYATGASLHMATKKPVAVAFDAGNLEVVAKKLREKYPQAQIIICADNDHAVKRDGRVKNVGLERAQAAAQAVGGKVVAPVFNKDEKAKGLTDFNDLHKSRGLEAVKKQLAKELSREMER